MPKKFMQINNLYADGTVLDYQHYGLSLLLAPDPCKSDVAVGFYSLAPQRGEGWGEGSGL
ncbi:MAG: hypothetical protein IPH35_08230 [Rhodoferax sp.]|nr:hypothetical protein [Rhodoferax sp.]